MYMSHTNEHALANKDVNHSENAYEHANGNEQEHAIENAKQHRNEHANENERANDHLEIKRIRICKRSVERT